MIKLSMVAVQKALDEQGKATKVIMQVHDELVFEVEAAAVGTLREAVRTRMCHALIDTLCALHRIDIDAVGLGNFAKREGYIKRQLKRWSGQWAQSKTRELPLMEVVHQALGARLPPPSPVTIAHGDYRLSNCMMQPDGTVAGVLDWELCTLGEPMADLGNLSRERRAKKEENSKR